MTDEAADDLMERKAAQRRAGLRRPQRPAGQGRGQPGIAIAFLVAARIRRGGAR